MEKFLKSDFLLKELSPKNAKQVFDYYLKNRNFHAEWFPKIENYYTEEFHRKSLENYQTGNLLKNAFKFGLFKNDEMIAHCNISAIERGVFQNGRLGYSIGKEYSGQNLMTLMICEVAGVCFKELKLHRIEANIMPRNIASLRVLEKNGFKKIGHSPQYLLINDRWEDHDMYMKLNENF
jgi:ribosomal-protein-alanine N-acetyltransferase